MSDVANWAGLETAPPAVRAVFRDPIAGDTADGGIVMSATQQWVCTLTAVSASDNYVAGIAVSPEGALRCRVTDGALPAGAVIIDGVAVSSTGQLCVSAVAALDHYVHGWPVSALGVVVIDQGSHPGDDLLQEDGFFLLQEDGSTIQLEA